MNTFIEDDNKLFNDILERNYFNFFRKGEKSFELILSDICSANCEYCYLKKHQEELFPISLFNKEKIINNCDKIIKWYIKNHFTCQIEIFSGEWLTTPLMEPIMNILFNNFKDVHNNQKPKQIIIPDNMNFIKNKELTNKIQEYINKFKNIGIPFKISASIDGKYCDDARTIHDDNFYIDCFNFLNKNKFLCHPMVSSSNIKNWKQNYLWWVKTAPKYITESLMTLEVRDETWTEESINNLLDYCNFLIDFKFKNYFNQDIKQLTQYIFCRSNNFYVQYGIECIPLQSYFTGHDTIHCNMSRTLHVRVPDLALAICHRTSYKELILGYLNLDDITQNINNNNIPLLVTKAHYKKSCMPCCEICPIEPICIGYCCGNSYENYKNLLVPTMEVCDMLKAKYSFLINKYNTMGVFDYIENNPVLSKSETQFLLDLKTNIDKLLY